MEWSARQCVHRHRACSSQARHKGPLSQVKLLWQPIAPMLELLPLAPNSGNRSDLDRQSDPGRGQRYRDWLALDQGKNCPQDLMPPHDFSQTPRKCLLSNGPRRRKASVVEFGRTGHLLLRVNKQRWPKESGGSFCRSSARLQMIERDSTAMSSISNPRCT